MKSVALLLLLLLLRNESLYSRSSCGFGVELASRRSMFASKVVRDEERREAGKQVGKRTSRRTSQGACASG